MLGLPSIREIAQNCFALLFTGRMKMKKIAIGFAALIVFVLEYSGSFKTSWVYRGIAWIGLYSYGIYLWHSLALAPGDMLIRKMTAMGLAPSVIWKP